MKLLYTVLILSLFPIGLAIFYFIRKNQRSALQKEDVINTESMLRYIEAAMVEITSRVGDYFLSDDGQISLSREEQVTRRLDKALTDCVYGEPQAISIVKAQINSLLSEKYTEEDLSKHDKFNFMAPQSVTDPYYQFEILINRLTNIDLYNPACEPIPNVIDYLNKKYDLLEDVPYMNGDFPSVKKEWDRLKLQYMFDKEVVQSFPVSKAEAVSVFSNIIFSIYKGHRRVETLMSLKIDGFEIGTSGPIRQNYMMIKTTAGEERWILPEDEENRYKYTREGKELAYSKTNSVWFQIKATWIHASFLNLESEDEMKLTIQQFSSSGDGVPLTKENAKKVVDMHDNSRVTLLRPPAGECWAVFVRKFSDSLNSIDILLSGSGVHNWQLVKELIKWIIRGECNTAFTGGQNTGKTTMMKDALCFFPSNNIRALEMSFELDLRQLYPERNTLTFKPTPTVSAADLQDHAKKMDSYMTIVGEIATDDVVPRLEQAANVGSACVIYSHHGNNDEGLIMGLAGSLIAAGSAQGKEDAVQRILPIMCMNVHLKLQAHPDGYKRVVEYVSEIVQEPVMLPYIEPEDTGDIAKNIQNIVKIQREYYQRRTDRLSYHSRHIIRFNEQAWSYEAGDGLTYKTLERILTRLHPEDRKEFIEWYSEHWLDRGWAANE